MEPIRIRSISDEAAQAYVDMWYDGDSLRMLDPRDARPFSDNESRKAIIAFQVPSYGRGDMHIECSGN